MAFQESTRKLHEIISRPDKVLTIMHPPSAHMAKVMEMAGAEAGFVGTSVVVGAYTGMEDVGVASIPESVMIGGWIARAVAFPVIQQYVEWAGLSWFVGGETGILQGDLGRVRVTAPLCSLRPEHAQTDYPSRPCSPGRPDTVTQKPRVDHVP